jgi:large subunit ribosomal protein L18
MQKTIDRKATRRRVRYRVRKRVSGSAARPRLAVFRSARHIYAQAIDDESGRTLAQASSLDKELRGDLPAGSNLEAAKQVGQIIAKRLKDSGVEVVVFDRGGYVYHGRVRALADAARESGLKF